MAFKGAKGSVTIIDKATKPLRAIASAFANLGKSSKKLIPGYQIHKKL